MSVGMEQRGGYHEEKWDTPSADGYKDSLYIFAYDWRLDNVENARLLIRKIEALQLKLKKPELKFDIVAHSMGGIISRYAAMYGDTDLPARGVPRLTWAGARFFGKIVLLGTPNEGSVNALSALVNGYSLGSVRLDLPFVQDSSKFMLAGTLDLNGIIFAQIQSPFRWYIIPQFIGFIVFLIAAFAETNRVPFDLPEAETELVAGFHTEYSALKFALFFMAEYVNMFTVSVMCTVLFLGGWYVPGLSHLFEVGSVPYAVVSHFAFIGKICAFLFFYIWVRGTLPRFRFDQLMNFGWKFLLPVALLNVILTIVVVFFLNR